MITYVDIPKANVAEDLRNFFATPSKDFSKKDVLHQIEENDFLWKTYDINDEPVEYIKPNPVKKYIKKAEAKAEENIFLKWGGSAHKTAQKAIGTAVGTAVSSIKDFFDIKKAVETTKDIYNSGKRAVEAGSSMRKKRKKVVESFGKISEKFNNSTEPLALFRDKKLREEIKTYINETIAILNSGDSVTTEAKDVAVGLVKGLSYLGGFMEGFKGKMFNAAISAAENRLIDGITSYDTRTPIQRYMEDNRSSLILRGLVAFMEDAQALIKNSYDRIKFQALMEEDKLKNKDKNERGLAINEEGELVFRFTKGKSEEGKEEVLVIGKDGFVTKDFSNIGVLISYNKFINNLLKKDKLFMPQIERGKVKKDKNNNWYILDNDNTVRKVYNGTNFFVNQPVDISINKLEDADEYELKDFNASVNYYLNRVKEDNKKIEERTLTTSEKFGTRELLNEIGDLLLPSIRKSDGKKLTGLPFRVLYKKALEIEPNLDFDKINHQFEEYTLKKLKDPTFDTDEENTDHMFKKLVDLIEFSEKLNQNLESYISTLSNDIGYISTGGAIMALGNQFPSLSKGFNTTSRTVLNMIGSKAFFAIISAAAVLAGFSTRQILRICFFLMKKVFRQRISPEARVLNEMFKALNTLPKNEQLDAIADLLRKYDGDLNEIRNNLIPQLEEMVDVPVSEEEIDQFWDHIKRIQNSIHYRGGKIEELKKTYFKILNRERIDVPKLVAFEASINKLELENFKPLTNWRDYHDINYRVYRSRDLSEARRHLIEELPEELPNVRRQRIPNPEILPPPSTPRILPPPSTPRILPPPSTPRILPPPSTPFSFSLTPPVEHSLFFPSQKELDFKSETVKIEPIKIEYENKPPSRKQKESNFNKTKKKEDVSVEAMEGQSVETILAQIRRGEHYRRGHINTLRAYQNRSTDPNRIEAYRIAINEIENGIQGQHIGHLEPLVYPIVDNIEIDADDPRVLWDGTELDQILEDAVHRAEEEAQYGDPLRERADINPEILDFTNFFNAIENRARNSTVGRIINLIFSRQQLNALHNFTGRLKMNIIANLVPFIQYCANHNINAFNLVRNVLHGGKLALKGVAIYKAAKLIINKLKNIYNSFKKKKEDKKDKEKKKEDKEEIENSTFDYEKFAQDALNWLKQTTDDERRQVMYIVRRNPFFSNRLDSTHNRLKRKRFQFSKYEGNRSLGYVPQNFLDSYFSRVYNAKMTDSLPKDQSMQTTVNVYSTQPEELETMFSSPEEQVLTLTKTVTDLEEKKDCVLEKSKTTIELEKNEDQTTEIPKSDDNIPNSTPELEEISKTSMELDEPLKTEVKTPEIEQLCRPPNPVIESSSSFDENSSSPNLNKTENMTLVRVTGNSKVLRCLKCNTFVSASKNHSEAECANRIRKFLEKRGKRKCSSKKKVDSDLFKNYRVLEKDVGKIVNRVKKLNKKYCKSSSKGKIPSDLKRFLETFSKHK